MVEIQLPSTYNSTTSHGHIIRTTYCVFVSLSAVIGNILILTAIKHGAFKELNNKLVIILQHLSVCDLFKTVGYVIPLTLSMLMGYPINTGWFCVTGALISVYCHGVSLFFICFMTVCKFLLIKFPMRMRSFSEKKGHVICFFMWILYFSIPVIVIAKYGYFEVDHYTYFCAFNNKALTKNWTFAFFMNTINLLLNITVAVVSIYLLCYINKSREASQQVRATVRWQGTITVVITSQSFCLTSMPVLIYTTLLYLNDRLGYELQLADVELYFTRFLTLLSIMVNVYIYSFTIPGFRQYLTNMKLFKYGNYIMAWPLVSNANINTRQFTMQWTLIIERCNWMMGAIIIIDHIWSFDCMYVL